jgi:hypothetical protein
MQPKASMNPIKRTSRAAETIVYFLNSSSRSLTALPETMFIERIRSETRIGHCIDPEDHRRASTISPSFIDSQNQCQSRNYTDQMIDFIQIRLHRIVTSSIDDDPPANRELEQRIDWNQTAEASVSFVRKCRLESMRLHFEKTGHISMPC